MHGEETLTVGLGDKVNFKAKGLDGKFIQTGGTVIELKLGGKAKIRSNAGFLYNVLPADIEVFRKATTE